MSLRDYQKQALAALRAAPAGQNRQAIVMATGLGKTVTFAAEAAEALETGQAERVLALTHTDELADQAERTVQLFAPDHTVGVVKAGRNEVTADIVIGSVQTLADAGRRRELTGVGRLIVDECHHATSPTYRKIMRHYGALDWQPREDCLYRDETCEEGACCQYRPTVQATGYTATLERGDGAPLGGVWHDVAFSRGISWAVRKGFLVPPVGYRVEVPSALPTTSDAALDAALVDSIAPESVVEAWFKYTAPRCEECVDAMEQVSGDVGHPVFPSYCPNDGCGTMATPRSTVVFAPLVRSARVFAEAFQAAGVTAAVVHGAMPKADRRAVLKAYNAGEITVVCNAMALTEGWDSPRTKCVVVARPTRSRPLFIQMAGRGLRPWLEPAAPPREEQDCALLVVSDSTPGLASFPDLSDKPLEDVQGKSLIALEDEYDLSLGLEPDPEHPYSGQVEVTRFDPLVQRMSKVWGTTHAGTLFCPSGFGGYVFIGPDTDGYCVGWVGRTGGKRVHRAVPDLELALGLGEDVAQDEGGNLASLVADRGRAWRKGVPTEDQKALAVRMGLERELTRIMASRSSGKAGRLADAIDKLKASKMIDPAVEKIKARI